MPISRLITTIILTIVAAVALYSGVYFAKEKIKAQSIESKQINFQLNDYLGESYHAKQWHGKVMLVNFWATWCAPCREEMPMLADFQDRYYQYGLRIVGISIDDPEPVQLFADSTGINYPLLIADNSTTQLMNEHNEVGAIPFSLLVDRSGNIVMKKLGVFTASELKKMLSTQIPELAD